MAKSFQITAEFGIEHKRLGRPKPFLVGKQSFRRPRLLDRFAPVTDSDHFKHWLHAVDSISGEPFQLHCGSARATGAGRAFRLTTPVLHRRESQARQSPARKGPRRVPENKLT